MQHIKKTLAYFIWTIILPSSSKSAGIPFDLHKNMNKYYVQKKA